MPDEHGRHDELLVAALAAGDLTGPERETTTRLVSECVACSTLHRDLRAIALATATLPAPVRRRDFRLSPDDAARARRSGLRGLLAAFGTRRFSFAMPVGGTLAALGVAALLLAAMPGTALPLAAIDDAATQRMDLYAASPGAGQTDTGQEDGAAAGGSDAPAAPTAAPAAMPDPSAGVGVAGGEIEREEGPIEADAPGAEALAAEVARERTADELLVILGGVALLVGIGLVGMRWSARRLT